MKHDHPGKKLLGKNLVLSIFISEPDRPWDADEKEEIFDLIFVAEEWLKKQAGKRRKSLQFENFHFGYDTDIVLDRIPSIDDDFDWMKEVCMVLGYSSPEELHDRLRNNNNSVLILFIANKSGRAFAIPRDPEIDCENLLEGAVTYKNWEEKRISAATIAHEIMHLYGAWDLYREKKEDLWIEEKAREEMPNEIMLELKEDIRENVTCELTSYLVGWRVKKKKWYDSFRPED